MRMRKKKNLGARLARVSDWLIPNPAALRGAWSTLSGGKPVRVEIGAGKGKFICESALQEPDCFFLGIELVPDVLVMAVEKAAGLGLPNVRFIHGDAAKLPEFFAPGEISRIYLNFSDPWPQNRHRPRRLTHEGFLNHYQALLPGGGAVYFKTDNRDLFDFSVKEFIRCGWTLKNITYDLHAEKNPDAAAGGPVTEYEERFSAAGVPINRLEAYPPATI